MNLPPLSKPRRTPWQDIPIVAPPARARMLVPAGNYFQRPASWIDLDDATCETRRTVEQYAGVHSQDHGPIHEYRIADALVTGQGAVVTPDGGLIRDTVRELIVDGRIPEGFVAGPRRGMLRLAYAVTRRIEEPCLLLKRPWWRNYGHMLTDVGGVLGLYQSLGTPATGTVVLGATDDPSIHDRTEELVRLLAPAATPLRMPDNASWEFADLRLVSPVNVPPMIKLPKGLEGLRKAVLTEDNLRGEPTPRRLFVGRRGKPRGLANADVVLAVCARHGLVEVTPETTDLIGQARLFHRADVIVGLKGAALTNIVFCRRGIGVVVLSPADFPDPFFRDIAGQRRLRYAEVFGVLCGEGEQGQRDFHCDPARVKTALERVAGGLLGERFA